MMDTMLSDEDKLELVKALCDSYGHWQRNKYSKRKKAWSEGHQEDSCALCKVINRWYREKRWKREGPALLLCECICPLGRVGNNCNAVGSPWQFVRPDTNNDAPNKEHLVRALELAIAWVRDNWKDAIGDHDLFIRVK